MGKYACSTTGSQCLPPNNFKYCLTLFSKFFSPFPHGTFSLSVSHRYLALDGIYHPFSAPFPRYTTLWSVPVRDDLQVKDGTLTLSATPFQELIPGSPLGFRLELTSRRPAKNVDLNFELLPVHSPLLGESLLVSFPPLNYMLKFGGLSCFIWDRVFKKKVSFLMFCLFPVSIRSGCRNNDRSQVSSINPIKNIGARR